MHWFAETYDNNIKEHCVGATVIGLVADGTFDTPKKAVLQLDNGLYFYCNTGQSGLDGEDFYIVLICTESCDTSLPQEKIILNKSTWNPSGFTPLNEAVSFTVTEPVFRSGMQELVGKKITAPFLARNQIGLQFEDGTMFVVKELSYGIVSAAFVLNKQGEEHIPVGKSLTNYWSQAESLYPGFVDEHLKQDDKIC